MKPPLVASNPQLLKTKPLRSMEEKWSRVGERYIYERKSGHPEVGNGKISQQ